MANFNDCTDLHAHVHEQARNLLLIVIVFFFNVNYYALIEDPNSITVQ
jgi:hypothetical protein